MRSRTLLLLAGLAGYALGLPTDLDARTFGNLGGGNDFIDNIKNIFEGHSPANILHGISPHAAAALGGSALGCKAGSVDVSYRKELAAWIHADAGLSFDVSLKKSLLAWCDGDDSFSLSLDACAGLSFFIPTCAGIAAEADLYINLDGVFSLAENVIGVLTATAQHTLSAAIALLGDIDVKVKTGLDLCAAGGAFADLSVEVKVALKAWLLSPKCSLTGQLKKSVHAWCEGSIGGDVISLPSIPTGGLASISVGNAVLGFVKDTGILTVNAQASLGAFLKTELGLNIDVEILKLLQGCAGGKHAAEFDYEARAALAAWLASSSCQLTVELKSAIVFWLSFGVSAGAEVSIDLSKNIITELTSFLLGTVDSLLGINLHGVLSLLLGGESVLSISLEARAQLAALCGGAAGFEIDAHIQIIIVGWLTGCHECCSGGGSPGGPGGPGGPTGHPHPHPSTTPSHPSHTTTPCETETPTGPSIPVTPTSAPSTPVIPTTPAIPTTSTTPTGPGATETSTPCETTTSETVTSSTTVIPGTPTGPGATETSTPCETTTSETVTSSTTVIPGTPTGPGATETSTPCETITSETVVSSTTVIPESSPSGPGATDTSTPCETITSETVVSSTTVIPESSPSGPGATDTSTPCETITTETVIPTEITKTTSAPEITAPPVPTTTKTKKTITLTTTVSVAYCPPE